MADRAETMEVTFRGRAIVFTSHGKNNHSWRLKDNGGIGGHTIRDYRPFDEYQRRVLEKIEELLAYAGYR